MRLFALFNHWLESQRGRLFLWCPLLFATGIGWYFSLRFEPDTSIWWTIALMGAGLLTAAWAWGEGRLVLNAALIVLAGFSTAGFRAHSVAENVLSFRYYGPVEGRIIEVDRSSSDAVRLTLDRVRLRDVPPSRTPARVRISLHGTQGFLDPLPGITVIATAHLTPPSGAVEPGGYDFRRHAWFQRLGATGYTRVPVLALRPHESWDAGVLVNRVRMRISARVQDVLGDPAGGFAAAITTGSRAGIEKAILEDLRAANLAHLLAISGLHMGLLTGFVYALFRYGLLLIPGFGLVRDTRRPAAFCALLVGIVYLALSGGNVATERAFIMVSVMFLAIFVRRRAVTLRSVAIAAMIVMILRPEALSGPGFQMSFAAATALVVVFGALQSHRSLVAHWPFWVRVLGGAGLSSLVAGMATAPIAAAHFNQLPHYGLIANILSVPLMGLWIIPAAVLAALLAPFGLEFIGLKLMEWPILWILKVAEVVASWPGSVSPVLSPDAPVLPMLAVGGVLVVVLQGRARWAGVPVLAAAFLFWGMSDRPIALISQTGGLLGVVTAEGRALSKSKGEGFAAEIWLENDGEHVSQGEAHARFQFSEQPHLFERDGFSILHATGKKNTEAAIAKCRGVSVVVVNTNADAPDGCTVIDARQLRKEGAIAIVNSPDGPQIVTARDIAGDRLWSQ